MSAPTTYYDTPSVILAKELPIGMGKTTSSVKSWSIFDTPKEGRQTSIESDLMRPEEKSISPGGQAISPGGQSSSFETPVALSTDTKTPNWGPSNNTLAANYTPEKLFKLINEFETRVKDAVLTAISSEDNQCRWVSDHGTNEQWNSTEKGKDIYRLRAKRAEKKAEDQLRRMAILLRPEAEFSQYMTNTELNFVAEGQEYSADTVNKNRGSLVKKLMSIATLPNIDTTHSEDLDHHLFSPSIYKYHKDN